MDEKSPIETIWCQSIKVFLLGGTGDFMGDRDVENMCQSIKVFLLGGTCFIFIFQDSMYIVPIH